MTQSRPPGLAGARARQLIRLVKAHRVVPARVGALSEALLDAPYVVSPLLGSAEVPEVFTASLEGFDCVTYVETVLALARARRAADFEDELRRIRYEDGRVEWARRNHYMTDWIRRNARRGVVRRVAAPALATRHERRLDAVPGLPPRRVRFACVPKARLRELEPRLRAGDLVFFASTRRDLDVFHCGILVKAEGGSWSLRHASRSRKKVVEQDLRDFLKENRMAGVIVVRPVESEAAPSRVTSAPS